MRVPRQLFEYWNNKSGFREIQRWLIGVDTTANNTSSENTVEIVTSDKTLTSTDGSISIDASLNSVTLSLRDPNTYKGIIYRIDVIDDTFGAYVSGAINEVDQYLRLYQDESIIIQDNSTSYRVK